MTNCWATIDFETRSALNIKKVGTRKYAEHESTVVLCLAYNLPGERTKLWEPSQPDPDDLLAWVEAGNLVEAHNSGFEYFVWNMCTCWPELTLEQMRCSAAKARAAGIPGSLEGGGLALDLDIQKSKEGKALIKLLCGPQRNGEYCNDPDKLAQLYDYCVRDVDSEMALSKALPEMSPSEIGIWQMDQRMNNRGLYIDKATVLATIQVIEQAEAKYLEELHTVTNGEIRTAGQRDKIMAWCERNGYALIGFTKDDVVSMLARDDVPASVRKVLRIRQILGRSSTSKYRSMLERMCSDGAVYDNLIYHKAHTGRWGGSGLQIQNLPVPTINGTPEDLVSVLATGSLIEVETWYDNPLEVASSAIRSMLMARDGNQYVAADYAAIEARMLFWLAKDESALDIFRRGECIYCEMGSTIYHVPASEILEGYRADDFRLTNMRKSGKNAVLGLGYQMGPDTFYAQNSASDPTLTLEFSREVVGLYRERFPKVPELWNNTESAAMDAMRVPGSTVRVSGSRTIAFRFDGYWLRCRLPSGRVLFYPNAKLAMVKTPWGDTRQAVAYNTYAKGQWKQVSTYGGKLTENIDQAVSRDIMAHGLLEAETAGYPPVMSIHDEGIAETPIGFGSQEEFEGLLCTLPKWANGLPLKASGWIGKRYRK